MSYFSFLMNQSWQFVQKKKTFLWAHPENAPTLDCGEDAQGYFFFEWKYNLKFRAPRQCNCLEDYFLYLQRPCLKPSCDCKFVSSVLSRHHALFSVHSFFNTCNWRKRKGFFFVIVSQCDILVHTLLTPVCKYIQYIFLNKEIIVFLCFFKNINISSCTFFLILEKLMKSQGSHYLTLQQIKRHGANHIERDLKGQCETSIYSQKSIICFNNQ